MEPVRALDVLAGWIGGYVEDSERVVVAGPPGQVEPKAAVSTDNDNIEAVVPENGIDSSVAVDARTLTESLAEVGVTDEIQYRLTQQAILSDFGLEALRVRDWQDLLQRATAMAAEGMKVKLAKALRYEPEDDMLRVCAGVGWNAGIVGFTRIAADLASPAGYALRTGKPVISNHLAEEQRFRAPPMLIEHGVRRAINVLIMAHGKPWGILEVDTADDGRFEVADIAFLQGFANLLGVAFERHDAEAQLRASIEHQRLLVSESSHRAKNSLAMLASLLSLQARASTSDAVKAALQEAIARIGTLASAHDLLWQSSAAGMIDVGRFLSELCERLQPQAPAIRLVCEADSIAIDADHAIAAGLLVTELVTNAVKHAYPGGSGVVELTCRGTPERFVIRVADSGVGLPGEFDLESARPTSLGMRMIRSLSQQIGGTIAVERGVGTAFVLTVVRS